MFQGVSNLPETSSCSSSQRGKFGGWAGGRDQTGLLKREKKACWHKSFRILNSQSPPWLKVQFQKLGGEYKCLINVNDFNAFTFYVCACLHASASAGVYMDLDVDVRRQSHLCFPTAFYLGFWDRTVTESGAHWSARLEGSKFGRFLHSCLASACTLGLNWFTNVVRRCWGSIAVGFQFF